VDPEIGISTRGALPPEAQLSDFVDTARRLGVTRILVPSIFELSRRLDTAELRDVRAAVHSAGLTIGVGLHFLHPHRLHAAPELLTAGDGDAVRGLMRTIECAALFDDPDLQFVVGDPDDRANSVVPWNAQLETLGRLLRHLRPVLLENGVRLCVKTHEEITSLEIQRLVDAAGEDILSVGFDPVNCLVQLEDPVAVAERLAPYIAHVYFDDATFVEKSNAFARLMCEIGEGAINWPRVRATLDAAAPSARWWVDLHKGQFTARPFDGEVLADHADLSVIELAAFLRIAMFESSRSAPRVDLLSEAQSAPWRRLDRACEALSAFVVR
jgi:3-oxoisoapionate decarboxylase